jgi:hypothetical protein
VQVQIFLRDSITQEHDYDTAQYDVIEQIGIQTDGNTDELRHSLPDKQAYEWDHCKKRRYRIG